VVRYDSVCPLRLPPAQGGLTVLKTLGAAVGALLVLLFLVTVASKLATPPERQEPVTQSALQR
jgi:hypothetical protein